MASSDEETEKIRKSITARGLSGLRNLGNTCYMNAALQCLFATNILTAHMIEKKFIDVLRDNIINKLAEDERKKQKVSQGDDVLIDKSAIIKEIKNTVTYAYYSTIKKWLSDNYVVEPIMFKQAIGKINSQFRGSSQNDSQELLNCLIDSMHEELKSKVQLTYVDVPNSVLEFRTTVKQYQKLMKANKSDEEKAYLLKTYRKYLDDHMGDFAMNSSLEYWEKYIQPSHSIIRDLLTGMTYTETKCTDCKITSLAFEPFIMASIAIPKISGLVTLDDCLKEHSSKCMLIDKNKYQCSNCRDYRDATQTTYMWELPEIFIIHLKRFTNEIIGNRCYTEKNSTKVDFPLTDLDLKNYISPFNKKEAKYDLYGVVQQFGSLNGGHYTACCKNAINNNWYEYDDSHVEYIEKDKLTKIVNSSAYILFYRKVYKKLDDSAE